MSDRIWADTTKSSRTLEKLSKNSYALYPYIHQETCDYGRIEARSKLIKGQRFSLIDWVTVNMIERTLLELNEVGSLFLWEQDGKRYGYFTGWEGKSGKYLTKRRKSPYPEPPADLLAKYLQDNNRFQTLPSTSKDFPKGKESKGKESKRKEIDILVDDFNSKCPSLQKVEEITKTRSDKIQTRLEEHPGLEWWSTVFERADKMEFTYEKGPHKGKVWRPSFDWLIENDNNAVKVAEGHYEDKKKETWRD